MLKFILLSIVAFFCFSNGIAQSNFNLPGIETQIDSIFDKESHLIKTGCVEQKHKLRFGYWKEFYTTGKLKSEGLFLMEEFMDCNDGKVFWQHYSYKTGPWKYYHENGKIMAEGTYETQIYKYPTACKGGYEIIKQKAGDNWSFYSDDEKVTKPTKVFIKEIEQIYLPLTKK